MPSIKQEYRDAQSPSLGLTNPTTEECLRIWSLTSLSWRDSLDEAQFLEESAYLLTVPLAKDGGMTCWILTDMTLPLDQRPILCSCETFLKRVFVRRGGDGDLSEKNVHGVASVFCDPEYRGRGYGARLMRELSKRLRHFHFDESTNVGSILYSDIGKEYYGALGWHPLPNNHHIALPALDMPDLVKATELSSNDIEQLCKDDEALIRKAMTAMPADGKTRVCVVPDPDHMLWHHCKEDFAAEKIFGAIPLVKGALVGESGSRMWAIFARRWYTKPDIPDAQNTLYVLRLVVENEEADRDTQSKQLKMILQTAQTEASSWRLQDVKIWDPSPLVQELVRRTGMRHTTVMREEEGIASLLWYGPGGCTDGSVEWIANERYAWC